MADVETNHDEPEQPETPPPGEFISEDLRAQTALFLAELKRRLARARDEEPKLGPPRRRK